MQDINRLTKKVISFLITLLLCFYLNPSAYAGYEKDIGGGEFTIGGFLRNESTYHLHRPYEIMKFKTFGNFEFSYENKNVTIGGPFRNMNMKLYVELRPEYEAVFDFKESGLGSNGREKDILYGGTLRGRLQDNLFENDEYNPFAREAWLYITDREKKFEAKLGRQLVTWGESDFIRLLDLVNPYNLREVDIMEDEDFKIPTWMANFTYWFSPENGLQLLWIPRYVPSWLAPEGSPWAFNSVYGLRGYKVHMISPAISFNDSDVGVRWKGRIPALNNTDYTLNFFHKWDPYPDLIFTPKASEKGTHDFIYKPNRLLLFGGSFSTSFTEALFIKDWVLRGEFVYYHHDTYSDFNGIVHTKDHYAFLLGFDKILSMFGRQDWWLSLQFYMDHLNSYDESKLAFVDAGLANVDKRQLIYSAMLYREFFTDRLRWDIAMSGTDNRDHFFWWRTYYDLTDKIEIGFGTKLYFGGKKTSLGEFSTRGDHIFLEIKRSF